MTNENKYFFIEKLFRALNANEVLAIQHIH